MQTHFTIFFRVQQADREQPLPILEEVGESIEVQTAEELTPATAPVSAPLKVAKLSPRPKMMPKKSEIQSRSASSSLNLRRSSNDSILEDRLGTIGRRLSRDITDSPPDLIHRFETFGKGSVPDNSKFDTFAGIKSRETSIPELSKYDTFSGVIDDRPEIPMKKGKKHHSKRTPLNLDIYERDRHINDTLSMSDSLYPPIFKLDRTKAVLRERVHNELKSKYPTERTYIVKRPQPIQSHKSSVSLRTPTTPTATLMNIQDKPLPPIPPHQEQPPPPPPKTPIYATSLKKQKKQQQQQQQSKTPTHSQPQVSSRKSLESLGSRSSTSTRGPKAAPRSSKSSLDIPPRLPPKTSPKSRTSNMSLGKLSKEDLLKLSQSSEMEIHKFLQPDHQHHHHPP